MGDLLLVKRGELVGEILGKVLFFPGNLPDVVMSSTMSSSSSSSSSLTSDLLVPLKMFGELRAFRRRRDRTRGTGLPVWAGLLGMAGLERGLIEA